MKIKFLNAVMVSLALTVSSFSAHAGIIDSSSVLLDDAGATQLETWLGQGDLDWDSIWYGATGATATSWHGAVDSAGPTVSIYDVTYNGASYLLGGYTGLSWGGTAWQGDNSNETFIFNLNSGLVQYDNYVINYYDVYARPNYFATFGAGHDLFGGAHTLGGAGYLNACTYAAFGTTATCGDVNRVNIFGVQQRSNFTVNGLETFTFAPAAAVPEPATLAIFALGMIGLASRRFKKQS